LRPFKRCAGNAGSTAALCVRRSSDPKIKPNTSRARVETPAWFDVLNVEAGEQGRKTLPIQTAAWESHR
jgi:hypothetical protein